MYSQLIVEIPKFMDILNDFHFICKEFTLNKFGDLYKAFINIDLIALKKSNLKDILEISYIF